MPLRVTPGPQYRPVHFLTALRVPAASACPHHHDVLPKCMGPDSYGLSSLKLCLKAIWLSFSCFCKAFVTELRKVSQSKRGEEEDGAECPGLSELHRGLGAWAAGRVKDRCVQVGLPTKLPGQTVLDLKEKGQAGRASDGSAPALPHVSSYFAQSPGFRKQRLLCSKAKL